jgi:cell shape-determining protein MreD
MKHCFYITILLFFVIIETVIFPFFPFFNRFYDLMVPFVIFFGMFRPFREGIVIVMLSGFVVDSLSGGYFGLYISIYTWLFLSMKWALKFLQLQHKATLPLVTVACIFIENAMLFGVITFLGTEGTSGVYVLKTITIQLMWAVITVPLIVIGLNQIHWR